MIERIEDMPAGTIGFRATGHVTGDEYRQKLLPPMREAVEAGDVRMVFVAGPDFEKFDPGALAVEWIRKALHMFAWMTPGEVRLFDLSELEAAKEWVAR